MAYNNEYRSYTQMEGQDLWGGVWEAGADEYDTRNGMDLGERK
jgi:hypothetical protein